MAAVLGGALLATGSALIGQTVRASESQVKALFLFNFAQFVEWPAAAVPDSQAPLVIGVLGDDPFGGFLDAAVRGERLGARPFVVRRYRRLADVTGCDILFISRSEAGRMEDILAGLQGRPILTVSDAEGFARRGGMIRFVTERSRVRLEINRRAAEAAGLTLSSKLLRVADVLSAPER
jgi:YfiR/HmsC-like